MTTGTVLITGATSGVGRHLAEDLASSGWTVLAHGRDPDKLATLVAELGGPDGNSGGAVRPFLADLASLDETTRLAEQISETVPRLDALVNNAGVGFGPPGGVRQTSRDGYELRFAVDYLAPVLLTRLLLGLLTMSAPSRIVNVGSVGQVAFDVADVAFEQNYSGVDAYRRAKLALAAYSFTLAEELKGSAVTVNCIHPASLMNTAMVEESVIAPMSTVEDGGRAVLRLIEDPALAEVSGEFFDGEQVARANPLAYDAAFQRALAETTGRMLAIAEPELQP